MLLSHSLAFTITLVLIRTVVDVIILVVDINFLPVAERNKLLILLAVSTVLTVILLVLPAVLLLVLLVLLTSQSSIIHFKSTRSTIKLTGQLKSVNGFSSLFLSVQIKFILKNSLK